MTRTRVSERWSLGHKKLDLFKHGQRARRSAVLLLSLCGGDAPNLALKSGHSALVSVVIFHCLQVNILCSAPNPKTLICASKAAYNGLSTVNGNPRADRAGVVRGPPKPAAWTSADRQFTSLMPELFWPEHLVLQAGAWRSANRPGKYDPRLTLKH